MTDKITTREKLTALAYDIWTHHAAEVFATLILIAVLAYLAVFH